MKNLRDNIIYLDQVYLEMLKYLNRAIDLNIEALESGEITPTILGESIVTENCINAIEVKLKEEAIIIIARFQPAAKDLRKLVMYIDSVRVVERMGDLLKGSLSVIRQLEKTEPSMRAHLHSRFLPLLENVKSIYEIYITAFNSGEENPLYALLAMDDDIDKLIGENTKYIIELMKNDHSTIEAGTLLLLLDKKYERVSDHINHLVQDLIYILKGDNVRKNELSKI